MQKPRHAALARRSNHHFRAAAINGMEIVLVRHPHAGQRGKVVNMVNIIKRFSHQRRIENRTLNKVYPRRNGCGRVNIENAHTAALIDKRSNQVLSDKAAAARNERLHRGG